MKIYVKIPPTILALVLLFQATASAAPVILNKVTLIDESSRMQIFIRLSELPRYTLETTGKRVDLVLQNTIASRDFTPLPENDKMIRMLSRQTGNRLRLSFYFRYPPQKVDIRKSGESPSLMLDILLGNPFSARYPDLSARLQGITMLNRDEVDYTNPIYATPWGTDWKRFFQEYESPVKITPPPIYTLPPFPLAANLSPRIPLDSWLPEQITDQTALGNWALAATELREQLAREEDESLRDRLLLTYAEALVRGDRYEEPYQLLQRIMLDSPETRLADCASLLFLVLSANHGEPYLAAIELDKLIGRIHNDPALSPWLNILQAELALQTDRAGEAREILARDNVAYIGDARLLRLLRQADCYYAAGEVAKALVAYDNLDKESKIAETMPASLARYADSLYRFKKYHRAAEAYHRLVDLTSGGDTANLVMFRLAMSRLHGGDKWTRILPVLGQVQSAFPGTEGAYRARLRQTDLYFLAPGGNKDGIAEEYGDIGLKANRTVLREEALLKQAMINALEGNHETSVNQAMTILREFRHGSLTLETRALILSQIAGVLKTMIRDKRYIAALVLAKKNRIFFARGWLDISLLYDLAEAYVQLGVYGRAVRAYKYILEVSSGEEQEKVYRPLLRALFESGRYAEVEDYADRYLFRYANSPGIKDIFLLRIKALIRDDKLDQAISLLDDPKRPTSPEIERTAARVYFERKQWDRVIEALRKNGADDSVDAEGAYLLAESLFQSGRTDEAVPVFQRLREEQPYVELAMFRLAEIALKQGDREEALKRFTELTEKGTDPRWVKMAKEEIRILQLEGELPLQGSLKN